MHEISILPKSAKTTPDLPTPEGAVDQQWRFCEVVAFHISVYLHSKG